MIRPRHGPSRVCARHARQGDRERGFTLIEVALVLAIGAFSLMMLGGIQSRVSPDVQAHILAQSLGELQDNIQARYHYAPSYAPLTQASAVSERLVPRNLLRLGVAASPDGNITLGQLAGAFPGRHWHMVVPINTGICTQLAADLAPRVYGMAIVSPGGGTVPIFGGAYPGSWTTDFNPAVAARACSTARGASLSLDVYSD